MRPEALRAVLSSYQTVHFSTFLPAAGSHRSWGWWGQGFMGRCSAFSTNQESQALVLLPSSKALHSLILTTFLP